MIDGKVVNAVLRGTSIEVVFELTPKQYAHWQYLLGEDREQALPCSHPGCYSHVTHPCEGCGRIQGKWPLDQGIVGEMQALLEHCR